MIVLLFAVTQLPATELKRVVPWPFGVLVPADSETDNENTATSYSTEADGIVDGD
jgi:hypothetical protein